MWLQKDAWGGGGADNPPASSCRAPLPGGGQQTPGMTQLGSKRKQKNKAKLN